MSKLEEIFQELYFDSELLNLRGMIIGSGDVIVYRKNNLLRHFEGNLDSTKWIDVSQTLSEPHILTDQIILSQIYQMKSQVQAQIGRSLPNRSFCLKIDPTWNISTLFGLLLNYPVIYFYSDVQTGENCLKQVDLQCNKIFLNAGEKERMLAYSFTFPKALIQICEPAVETWFEKLAHNLNELVFEFEKEFVNLDCVLIWNNELLFPKN